MSTPTPAEAVEMIGHLQTYRDQVALKREQMFDRLDEVLYTFAWTYPGREEPIGEVSLDRDTAQLHLTRYVPNHDDPDPEADLMFLEARADVDVFRDAREQIRDLIHWYLCHEADEQMFFDGEMTFDPHQRPSPKGREIPAVWPS